MSEKQLRQAIRETKREMKANGIRRTSCFNGGLTPDEYRYNARLFELEVRLKDATRSHG